MHHYIHQAALAPDSAPVFQLTLRRTHLVEDTFRQLASADHCAFQRELLVNEPPNICEIYFRFHSGNKYTSTSSPASTLRRNCHTFNLMINLKSWNSVSCFRTPQRDIYDIFLSPLGAVCRWQKGDECQQKRHVPLCVWWAHSSRVRNVHVQREQDPGLVPPQGEIS